MFPRSIPSLATKQEPSWASTAATASADRMEWKRSYDDVARAAGVGIDSTGKPITPVGDGAGKPLEIFPMSRPASVASSREESNFDVVQAPMGKKGWERDLKDEAIKKSGGFVLPETLSPRDGHARMRNVGVLKKVPSRLGRLRESALSQKTRARDAQAVIIEESDGEEDPETSPNAVPEPPKMRLMDRKPIRFTSGETKEATSSSSSSSTAAPTARANLIPARRVTRSHAAEQRAAAAIPEAQGRADTASQPDPPGMYPVRSATVPTPEARLSSQESTSDKPRGPEKIELGSFCQSSVGKPIKETTTTAVLLSLQSIVSNLTAFTSDNMHSLPPTPESTSRAVRAFRAGEKNRAVFIQKWVDYTNKYGMAYMLSDGTRATLFNDNTSLVVDGIAGELVEWITCSFTDPPQIVRGYKEFVYRRLMTDINVIRGRSNGSRSLKSKWTIWKRTNNYMDSCLDMMAENSSCDRKDAVRESSMELQGNQANLLWITHYARLRKCTIFRLIDGTMQVRYLPLWQSDTYFLTVQLYRPYEANPNIFGEDFTSHHRGPRLACAEFRRSLRTLSGQ
jgi:polo-like kinase 1